ncbi:MAG: hypothetical protein ACLFTK_11135, partial [Anaerolineales bacterium]
NVASGHGNDTFVFSTNTSGISGNVDGGDAGTDLLDYSALTIDVTVDLATRTATNIGGTFINIDGVIGGASLNDTLQGYAADNTWTIAANQTDQGNLNGLFSFQDVENLTGTDADDTFIFEVASRMRGRVDGRGGANTLDYSSYSSADLVITLTGQGDMVGYNGYEDVSLRGSLASPDGNPYFFNITNLIGGPRNGDLITGANETNIWTISGADAGDLNNRLTFSSIEFYETGDQDDTFVMLQSGSISGTIDENGGINTLDYTDYTTDIVVNLETGTATNINNGVSGNFSNVFAGSGDDVITGNSSNNILDGGTGFDRLNFFNLTLPVIVNLATGTAIGPQVGTDQIANFEHVIGGQGNDQLTGDDNDNWFTGGPGNDIINGGGGTNTIDESWTTLGIDIDLNDPFGPNTGTAVGPESGTDALTNITNMVGGRGDDNLRGRDGENTVITGGPGNNTIDGGANSTNTLDESWVLPFVMLGPAVTGFTPWSPFDMTIDLNITTDNGQDVNGDGIGDTLRNITNVFTNAGNDTIIGNNEDNIIGPGAGDDTVQGGGGIDTLDYSPVTADSRIIFGATITTSGGIGNDLLSDLENYILGSGNDTFEMVGNSIINGFINGGAGIDTLDYSGYGGAITADYLRGIFTGVVGQTISIENIIGSPFADFFYADANFRNEFFVGAGDVAFIYCGLDAVFGTGATVTCIGLPGGPSPAGPQTAGPQTAGSLFMPDSLPSVGALLPRPRIVGVVALITDDGWTFIDLILPTLLVPEDAWRADGTIRTPNYDFVAILPAQDGLLRGAEANETYGFGLPTWFGLRLPPAARLFTPPTASIPALPSEYRVLSAQHVEAFVDNRYVRNFRDGTQLLVSFTLDPRWDTSDLAILYWDAQTGTWIMLDSTYVALSAAEPVRVATLLRQANRLSTATFFAPDGRFTWGVWNILGEAIQDRLQARDTRTGLYVLVEIQETVSYAP